MQPKLDQRALDAALGRLDAFIVEDKRKQIHQRLLAAERRAETLATLPRWLSCRTAPLEGTDKSPAGLEARFGNLVGVRIAADGATRTTIGDALVRGRSVASVFIADNGHVALLTHADATAPTLCSKF